MSSPFHHLLVAQDANANAYRRLVQTSASGECWDILVLTAANEKQADGYRRELELRSRRSGSASAFFPAIQRTIVVPDPPGRRAGSGGATLGVMQAIQRELGISAKQLQSLRILLIHSGGASQRLPMYSPLGKIFSPLPLLRPDGQIATLFDHLYITLCGLPEKLGPGMLILAGDVFLLFDHRHVSTPRPGVSAITMRVPAEVGRGHGVFVTDSAGQITRTLQKVSVDEMAKQGATDVAGQALIDTGILFFDAAATLALYQLACPGASKPGLHERFSPPIDLYEDITLALASGTQRTQYLSSGHAEIRASLWRRFHGVGFQSTEIGGEFLHLGTTQQFRDAMTGRSSSPAAELFQRNVLTHSEWNQPIGPRVYHSALLRGDSVGKLGAGCVIEFSILGGGCDIGENCVVSQAVAVDSPLRLPPDTLFFQVPVTLDSGSGFAHVLCGTADDFKGSMVDERCLYLNAPMRKWLERHRISSRQVWGNLPPEKQTLWNARLFPVTAKRDESRRAQWLCGTRSIGAAQRRRWLDSPRISMAEILESCDAAGLIEHREIVAAYLQTGHILDAIRRRQAIPVDVLFADHSTPAAYAIAERLLASFASQESNDPQVSLEQARARWVCAQLLLRPSHPEPAARGRAAAEMTSAFARIALASESGHRSISAWRGKITPAPVGTIVEATSPVRLDLTGGWSDTPPYCYEEGGHVINVAIDLDGRPPVRAVVRRTREPRIILESRDLGATREITAADLRKISSDPRDPFALHAFALQLTGLADGKPLGLHITTECRVPKGSGLGTSSILAATLLAALARFAGRQPTTDELIEATLLVEQRLSTGGGWQDQVGGLVGGIKSTTSAPGIPQRPIIEQMPLSAARLDEFEQRLVVYYSGQQRLARDILRRVEGRWLAREPAAVMLKRELKTSASAMRAALVAWDWDAMASEISRYWRIKRDLYPGSTTPSVDVLLLEMQGQYTAASLAGAGGGGFGFFLCASPQQAAGLRTLLAASANRPGSLASVYETRINRTGLQVNVTQAKGNRS